MVKKINNITPKYRCRQGETDLMIVGAFDVIVFSRLCFKFLKKMGAFFILFNSLSRIVPLEVPTIELAGGSVRCMLAGIHLTRRGANL